MWLYRQTKRQRPLAITLRLFSPELLPDCSRTVPGKPPIFQEVTGKNAGTVG